MIYHSSIAQGFVNIMKDIEAINESLETQYSKVYNTNRINNEDNEHKLYSEAQMQVCKAYDAVALLLSDILTREE